VRRESKEICRREFCEFLTDFLTDFEYCSFMKYFFYKYVYLNANNKTKKNRMSERIEFRNVEFAEVVGLIGIEF
jgi:hypothetical protein